MLTRITYGFGVIDIPISAVLPIVLLNGLFLFFKVQMRKSINVNE